MTVPQGEQASGCGKGLGLVQLSNSKILSRKSYNLGDVVCMKTFFTTYFSLLFFKN